MTLTGNSGRHFVGSVSRDARDRGWFFGHFMDEELLGSDLVEVAWQTLPSMRPSRDQAHFHTSSVEMNVVVGGTIEMWIDDVPHVVSRGDFYVIWPGSVIRDITSSEDAEVIVVRAPSGPYDKESAVTPAAETSPASMPDATQ